MDGWIRGYIMLHHIISTYNIIVIHNTMHNRKHKTGTQHNTPDHNAT